MTCKAQSRAVTGPKVQSREEGSPLEGKPPTKGVGDRPVMAAGRKWSFREQDTVGHTRVFPVLGMFPRYPLDTKKMKPGSCPGLWPFIPEMALSKGSWPLPLEAPHPCGQ